MQELVTDHVPVGPDESDLGAQSALQHMLEDLGRAGLAAGPGKADDLHLSGGVAEEIAAGDGEPVAAVGNLYIGRPVRGRILAQYGRRAVGNGLGDEAVSVRLKSLDGDKEIARLRFARIVADPGDLRLRIGAERQHRKIFHQLTQLHVRSPFVSSVSIFRAWSRPDRPASLRARSRARRASRPAGSVR